MKLTGSVLALGLSSVIFTGCGGVQNATVTPVTVSQSRMHRASGSSGLIYATFGCGGTCVLSYPDGSLVGSLNVGDAGACADASGNVYIADKNNLLEFTHGGSTPIKTYSVPNSVVNACSVDPVTGNLALAADQSNSYNVAIFKNGSTTPSTTYLINFDVQYCGYDNVGNLFVDGYSDESGQFALYELTSGGNAFTEITVNPALETRPGQVQWDGSHLTIEGLGVRYGVTIYQLSVSGSTASVVKTVKFKGVTRTALQSWIDGNRVFMPYGTTGNRARKTKVGVWQYPRGGKAVQSFGHFGRDTDFQAVTFSPGS